MDYISLRSIGERPLDVIERDTGRVIGMVDMSAVDRTVHPGAVYLHQGSRTWSRNSTSTSTRRSWWRPGPLLHAAAVDLRHPDRRGGGAQAAWDHGCVPRRRATRLAGARLPPS
uniref:hypothetical protein n=1 Tax=Tessaracoccus coleopterorum TaxID=2714950 RepID=UPI001E357F8F|nr:hypothetical protein [Tessaracoccus coleopterorum]